MEWKLCNSTRDIMYKYYVKIVVHQLCIGLHKRIIAVIQFGKGLEVWCCLPQFGLYVSSHFVTSFRSRVYVALADSHSELSTLVIDLSCLKMFSRVCATLEGEET